MNLWVYIYMNMKVAIQFSSIQHKKHHEIGKWHSLHVSSASASMVPRPMVNTATMGCSLTFRAFQVDRWVHTYRLAFYDHCTWYVYIVLLFFFRKKKQTSQKIRAVHVVNLQMFIGDFWCGICCCEPFWVGLPTAKYRPATSLWRFAHKSTKIFPPLPETKSLPLKIDKLKKEISYWKTTIFLGGELLVLGSLWQFQTQEVRGPFWVFFQTVTCTNTLWNWRIKIGNQ